MSICDFVLIQLTDFELECKTQILDQVLRQICSLIPTGRGQTGGLCFLESSTDSDDAMNVYM